MYQCSQEHCWSHRLLSQHLYLQALGVEGELLVAFSLQELESQALPTFAMLSNC